MSAEINMVKRISPEFEEIDGLPGCKIIRTKVFPDSRGFFSETYNFNEWKSKFNFNESFLQDNHSFSKLGVVRGLHSQTGMGKLVTVISGKIFDVAVDVRPGSATFGKWHGVVLDGESKNSFWIPDGFLHGFQCLSEEGAHVFYKCSAVYNPAQEFGINPFDPEIGIKWPISDPSKCIVSEKDQKNPPFSTLHK